MADHGGKRRKGVDPTWPEEKDGQHAVSELISETQGAHSPFGTIEFPVDPSNLPYHHPHTEINR
ncbi:hypothetical protein [Nakamurella leprariae]|uniref:Uncharacterized protein n=1 Tax=Nakamurella leprariae TaxID=2803911 RepID=A0A939C0S5_9ACTN|nr:hypothetical protein [Nakamurella leprariae]MBM9466437.1 hypothetical protein [Nakamurella leprariae]